jgi:hypothetical protein
VREEFIRSGFCEAIMPILEKLISKESLHRSSYGSYRTNSILKAFYILSFIPNTAENYSEKFPRLISAGLLDFLVKTFLTPNLANGVSSLLHNKEIFSERRRIIKNIVKDLYAYDGDCFMHQFGIPEGSGFFDSIH